MLDSVHVQCSFFHGLFDISTGTEPRQGYCGDQENDGDVQREESSSFLSLLGKWKSDHLNISLKHLKLKEEDISKERFSSAWLHQRSTDIESMRKGARKVDLMGKTSKWCNLLNHMTTCMLRSVKKKKKRKSTRMCCIYASVTLIKTVFML